MDELIENPKNKGKKKEYEERFVIRVFLVLILAAVLLFIIRPDPLLRYVDRLLNPYESHCNDVYMAASNTLAALASYFSESDKNEVPTLQYLVKSEDLDINKNLTVIIDGTKDRLRVTVIDNKKRCVQGNKWEVYMGGASGTWYFE